MFGFLGVLRGSQRARREEGERRGRGTIQPPLHERKPPFGAELGVELCGENGSLLDGRQEGDPVVCIGSMPPQREGRQAERIRKVCRCGAIVGQNLTA